MEVMKSSWEMNVISASMGNLKSQADFHFQQNILDFHLFQVGMHNELLVYSGKNKLSYSIGYIRKIIEFHLFAGRIITIPIIIKELSKILLTWNNSWLPFIPGRITQRTMFYNGRINKLAIRLIFPKKNQ